MTRRKEGGGSFSVCSVNILVCRPHTCVVSVVGGVGGQALK